MRKLSEETLRRMEEYIRSFGDDPGEEEKKALDYGIRALLETGEEIL